MVAIGEDFFDVGLFAIGEMRVFLHPLLSVFGVSGVKVGTK